VSGFNYIACNSVKRIKLNQFTLRNKPLSALVAKTATKLIHSSPQFKKCLAAIHAVNAVAKSANLGNVNAKFNYKPALCDASLAL